jgi:hypothetical protein
MIRPRRSLPSELGVADILVTWEAIKRIRIEVQRVREANVH